MINETMIFFHLRKTIGDVLVDAMTPQWYLNVIESDTLFTWAEFFPYIIRGVCIRQQDAIPAEHPQTKVLCSSFLYRVPKEQEDIEYINIEQFYYPGNIIQNQTSSNLPALNGVLGLVNKNLPGANYYNIVRYSAWFTPPDILEINPKPMNHLNFTVNMQRKPKLYEIPMYYRRYFLSLCEYDCKLALWAKFRNLRDGATYQGLEINTSFLSELGEAKSERETLLDLLQKNYWKDPSRYEALMTYAN